MSLSLDQNWTPIYNRIQYNESYYMVKDSREDPPSTPIRLTPVFFHILLSVVAASRHGYAIMQDVQQRTGGAVQLGPGSLYWAIKRLVDAKLLEATGAPAKEADSRRRYYRLTQFGRKTLRQEVRVLADIVGYAESTKLIRPRST